MAAQARMQSVATAVPHLQSSTQAQSAPLHVSTQLDPAASTDTTSSTSSSYRTDQLSDEADSPASSRTSLLTFVSTTLLQPEEGTTPAMKSVENASGSQAASAKSTNVEPWAVRVEQRGRPARKPKPTTKAIELANNTGSKFFKSLKNANASESSQVEEADDANHQSASENRKAKLPSIAPNAKSTAKFARQSVKRQSLTRTTQDDIRRGESLDRIETRKAKAGGRRAAGEAAESSLAGTAASASSPQPPGHNRTRGTDEVVEPLSEKQRISPTVNAKPTRSRRKQPQQEHEEGCEGDTAKPLQISTRATKASTKNHMDHELLSTKTAIELSQCSEHAPSKVWHPRGSNVPAVPTKLPDSGYKGSGTPSVKLTRIKLKFPSPPSGAGSEVPEDEDSVEAAMSDQNTKKGRRKIKVPQGKSEKLKPEKGFTSKLDKKKRKSWKPLDEVGEFSEDELAHEPTEPRSTKKARHTSSGSVKITNMDRATLKASSMHKSKRDRKGNDQPQRTPKTCNGLCLTMPEKIIAMYEIVTADPDRTPHTQEELDTLMLSYCKCEEQQDQVPEQKIMLKFRGFRKDKDVV